MALSPPRSRSFTVRLPLLLAILCGLLTPAFAEDTSAIVLPPDPSARPDMQAMAPTSSRDANRPCLAALAAAGVVFETRGRHEGSGQCGIDDAVEVSAIRGTALQPSALLSCQTALAWSDFMTRTITSQARTHLGSTPSTLFVAASYACRGRNNVPGARLSEHSFGRAIDVRGMELADGTTWSVRPHASGSSDPAARFQTALRQAACGPFKTVLGPGSDGHHERHIHFDMALRSSTYCR